MNRALSRQPISSAMTTGPVRGNEIQTRTMKCSTAPATRVATTSRRRQPDDSPLTSGGATWSTEATSGAALAFVTGPPMSDIPCLTIARRLETGAAFAAVLIDGAPADPREQGAYPPRSTRRSTRGPACLASVQRRARSRRHRTLGCSQHDHRPTIASPTDEGRVHRVVPPVHLFRIGHDIDRTEHPAERLCLTIDVRVPRHVLALECLRPPVDLQIRLPPALVLDDDDPVRSGFAQHAVGRHLLLGRQVGDDAEHHREVERRRGPELVDRG